MKSILRFIEKARTIDRDIVRAMGIFAVIVLLGSVVYASLEGWSYLDSTYFSIITLTTIGYGDMHPVQISSKIFTIFYVLFGVGLVFYLFTSIAQHLFEDEKKEIRRLDKTIAHLEELLESKKNTS